MVDVPPPTRVSEGLFGRRCRLGVALYALQHPKGRFFQSEPPLFPSATGTAITAELQRLVGVGMLHEERPDGSNKVFYVRATSPLWKVVALAASLTGLRWEEGRLIEGAPYAWDGWPLEDQ